MHYERVQYPILRAEWTDDGRALWFQQLCKHLTPSVGIERPSPTPATSGFASFRAIIIVTAADAPPPTSASNIPLIPVSGHHELAVAHALAAAGLSVAVRTGNEQVFARSVSVSPMFRGGHRVWLPRRPMAVITL